MNSLCNAGLSRDFPEPDYSDEARDDAIAARAEQMAGEWGAISDAFDEGFKVPEEVCRMLSKWNRGPRSAFLLDAILDAMHARFLDFAREEIDARDKP